MTTQFWRSVAAGNVNGAIQLCTKDSAKGVRDQFVQLHSHLVQVGGMQAFQIVNVDQQDQDDAKVRFSITFGNGDTHHDDAPLIRENGAWKLNCNG